VDQVRAAAVLTFLLLFGVAYNELVGRLEKGGHDRGYTSFLVVGGVAVTLLGGAVLVGLGAMLWFFLCFAASGLAMVIGSWSRFARARKEDSEQARQYAKELLHATEKKGDGLHDEGGDPAGQERE
jgi:membrane protein DedA with SNARE-associated domain